MSVVLLKAVRQQRFVNGASMCATGSASARHLKETLAVPVAHNSTIRHCQTTGAISLTFMNTSFTNAISGANPAVLGKNFQLW